MGQLTGLKSGGVTYHKILKGFIYSHDPMIFTGPNEVVAKVMSLHVSVILSTGGFSRQPPPGPGRPPRQGEPPRDQADPPPGRRLQHTVNERPVRILLECILVFSFFKTGVSSYYPYNMEHILLIYLPGEEFDKYPKCDTQEVTYENNMEDQCYMRTSTRGPTQTHAEYQTL